MVELKLETRDVKEAAEVDVVDSSFQRATHDGHVQPVRDRVDDDVGTGQRTRYGGSIRSVDVLLTLEPCVSARDVHSPLLEEVDDDPSDRP